MASIINASSSGSGGIVQTADASGVLQLQTNGTVALNVDTSANISIGTTTANSVAGNSNARYFAVQGDGTLSSADGRIILSNPRAYASISAGSTTAGRLYFQLTNGSGGTITEAANIDALASGSGGASGYGLDIRFLPKADNGSSAEAARIKSGGTFILAGGSTSATGTGITFPATQSASSNANTLDDYEEGSWTPVLAGVGGGATSGGSIGTYTKIGNRVTIDMTFVNPNAATLTGSWIITGIPFPTYAPDSSAYHGGPITYTRDLPTVANGTVPMLQISGNVSQFGVRYIKNTTGETTPITGNVPANSLLLSATVTYETNT